MGSDNLVNFHKWKNFNEILRNHQIYLYPRPNTKQVELMKHPNVNKVDAPLMEISSSFIRKAIKDNKDVRFFLPNNVWLYIKEMHFYEI